MNINNSKNGNDLFAKEHWKNFEELALSILKCKLDNQENYNFYVHKTPDQNDGGYDGIIIIEPKTLFTDNIKELYTILTEAKLRKNANKDLPLSDFSKTLIIAINRNAQRVYIFTNLHFSSETMRRINKFSNSTDLDVKLIDLFAICEELDNFPSIKEEFPDEFLDSLYKALPLHNNEKRICYEKEDIAEQILPKLVGDERWMLLDSYVNLFKKRTGTFIISGIQGCGKSLFIKHIIKALKSEIACKIIHLEKFSTIKEFFIMVLSLIWNVEPLDIYNLTEHNIDEIIFYLPAQYMPKRIKSVLLNILNGDQTEYEDRQDVFEEHLLEYLYYIFRPICQRKKQLFVFTNIEKCKDNILKFTNKFIRKFSSENMIFLMEVRTDIPHLKEYIDEWSQLNLDVEPIKLGEFNYLEYFQYMQAKYPQMNEDDIEKFYSICYPLPLYIDNLLTFIKSNGLEHSLSSKELTIQKLYKNEKYKKECFVHSLNFFLKSQNEYCKKLAYVIGFFDGELSLKNINKLGIFFEKAIVILANSMYFDLEGDNLRIHHLVYLSALQSNKIVNEFELNEIAHLLYNTIDDIQIDASVKEVKKLELAISLGKDDYVRTHWEYVCKKLINQNDFSLSKYFLKKILYNNWEDYCNKLHIINKIIKCYIGLNDYKSKELENYISWGTREFYSCRADNEKILFCYLKAKYYLSIGKYRELIRETNLFRNEDQQVRYIRALGIKHIYGIDACLLSLMRGKKHLTEKWRLDYSYLDHMHSKYEKLDFEKGWEYLIQIEQYLHKLSIEDQIHYEYNKVALEMYKTGTRDIEKCRRLLVRAFENVLPVESGRIHNLLGQIYYINADFAAAEKEFKNSFSILQQHTFITYIYVPLMNLTLLYEQQNDNENCLIYALKTINCLIAYKKEKIERQFMDFNEKTFVEKECALFITAMEIIKKLDDNV